MFDAFWLGAALVVVGAGRVARGGARRGAATMAELVALARGAADGEGAVASGFEVATLGAGAEAVGSARGATISVTAGEDPVAGAGGAVTRLMP